MNNKIIKDIRRRILVEKHWVERLKLKIIKEDIRNSVNIRNNASILLKSENKDLYSSRVRNRCIDTGNSRSVLRWFRRSGLRVREMARMGILPGVYKKSW